MGSCRRRPASWARAWLQGAVCPAPEVGVAGLPLHRVPRSSPRRAVSGQSCPDCQAAMRQGVARPAAGQPLSWGPEVTGRGRAGHACLCPRLSVSTPVCAGHQERSFLPGRAAPHLREGAGCSWQGALHGQSRRGRVGERWPVWQGLLGPSEEEGEQGQDPDPGEAGCSGSGGAGPGPGSRLLAAGRGAVFVPRLCLVPGKAWPGGRARRPQPLPPLAVAVPADSFCPSCELRGVPWPRCGHPRARGPRSRCGEGRWLPASTSLASLAIVPGAAAGPWAPRGRRQLPPPTPSRSPVGVPGHGGRALGLGLGEAVATAPCAHRGRRAGRRGRGRRLPAPGAAVRRRAGEDGPPGPPSGATRLACRRHPPSRR